MTAFLDLAPETARVPSGPADLSAPRIAGVAQAFPPHQHAQADITAAFRKVVLGNQPQGSTDALLQRFHGAAGVRTRSLALPLDAYGHLGTFGQINDLYLEVATDLGEQAVRSALRQAGLEAADVGTFMTVSVTGMGAPGVDARLIPRLGLGTDVRRVPVFGLGCVAGAAGLARVTDLVRGDPDAVAVLLAVELCSLTVQRNDTSPANLVASGLFGDGACAVVVLGERRAREMGAHGPTVVATRSRFYPGTERLMGWEIGATGFRIVLEPTVADVVREHVGEDVRRFLATHGLTVADIASWVMHPGGPKVLMAVEEALEIPREALQLSWDSLAEFGNLSSVSVLEVLSRTSAQAQPGDTGVLVGMGVGFCAEMVLLQW